ncbi:MAG: hypothetical protein ACPLVI_03120 [Thermoplasmata archaeon]|jgi:hypothetical protein|nr:hypothetical protein [Thermoplasmatales archaeon]PMP74973.1 MAG: hypothetical protein C0180_02750 [Aciduliprofundum sp.]HEU13172.1 hypothetical protein [Euryarchaeota archaeon]
MKNFPLSVIKYALPLIIILAFFSFFSGSTLYFFISFIFLLSIFIIIYPFYESSYQPEEKEEKNKSYEREQDLLEKRFEEAKNGNPVAQRLIEERVFMTAVEEISDRTGKSVGEIIELIEKDEIAIDKEALNILMKFLNRRNSMDLSVDGNEFERDIKFLIKRLGD